MTRSAFFRQIALCVILRTMDTGGNAIYIYTIEECIVSEHENEKEAEQFINRLVQD